MEITELDDAKMKVMKEIADSNVILAGLQAEVLQASQEKDKLFIARFNEVDIKIKDYLRESQDLLNDTEQNYTHVHNFYEELKKFADLVKEEREEIGGLLIDLNNKTVDLENYIKRQTTEISELKAEVKRDFTRIEEDRRYIKQQREELAREKAIFNAKAANLKVALEALNNKRK